MIGHVLNALSDVLSDFMSFIVLIDPVFAKVRMREKQEDDFGGEKLVGGAWKCC